MIALVITIIVMIILVVVTIKLSTDGGLFDYARKATNGTTEKAEQEQELAKGNVSGKTIDEWVNGEEAQEDGLPEYSASLLDPVTGVLTTNAKYTDTNAKIAIIPAGFKVLESAGTTIAGGLVIQDKDGNEFVWIPVPYAIVTAQEIENIITTKEYTDVKDGYNWNREEMQYFAEDMGLFDQYAVSSLDALFQAMGEDNFYNYFLENGLEYGWNQTQMDSMCTVTYFTKEQAAVQDFINQGIYPMAVEISEGTYKGILYNFKADGTISAYNWATTTGVREPANLSSQYKDNTSNLSIWTNTLYQDSYNKMVKSVDKNGGFWVGRYENGGTLKQGETQQFELTYTQSQANLTPMIWQSWFKLYECQKKYAEVNGLSSVESEMIWGSQWDQVMFFVDGNNDGTNSEFKVNEAGNRYSRCSVQTGETIADKVCNIYDLEASCNELVQTAYNDDRYMRGGNWSVSKPATYGQYVSCQFGGYNSTSRTTLYINNLEN